jgi:hypothetical protein
MLKKPASGVLSSLRGSTYRSVCLAASLAAALLDGLLSILRECSPLIPDVQSIKVLAYQNSFSAA